MRNEQFTSETIGHYIAVHDSADNALCLSWSGGQPFMDEREFRALLSLLQHLFPYENSVRNETDYGYLEGTDAA